MTRARRTTLRSLAALTVAGIAIAAAGCGGGSSEEANLEAGKETFAASCASCHTLADAGSYSQIGPNLDDSWRASHDAGISDEQFEGTIKRWIKIAQLPMPRDLVEGQDAANVAAYIASVAGRTPESDVYPAQSTPEAPNPPRIEIY